VARGIDEVDGSAVPGEGGGGGVDGDAALLLFGVVVHDGGAVVDLAHFVGFAGVVEDALGDGGLSGVDMGGNADVADCREFSGAHGFVSRRRRVSGPLRDRDCRLWGKAAGHLSIGRA